MGTDALKRTLIFLLAAAALAVRPAAATGSRASALAGASDFVLDDSQIHAWPCRAPLYYRALIAELGVDGSRVSDQSSVAGYYSDQERSLGVIGLAVNRRTAAQEALAGYIRRTYVTAGVSAQANIIERFKLRAGGRGAGLRHIPAPGGGIELSYARSFGDWTPGLRIERSRAEDSENITGSAGEASAGVTGVTLSAGYQPRDGLRADAALEYAGHSFSSRFTLDAAGYEERLEADAARTIGARARAFYSLGDEMTLVPRLALERSTLGYAYSQSDTGRGAAGTMTATDFALGAGWLYSPNPRYTVIAAADLGYAAATVADSLVVGDPGDVKSVSKTWTVPAVHLGLETQLTRWLAARIGGSKRISSTEIVTDYSTGEAKTVRRTSDSYRLGCGLGFRIGGFALDLAVNPEVLYSGGNVLSGSKTWPVSQVSMIYRY